MMVTDVQPEDDHVADVTLHEILRFDAPLATCGIVAAGLAAVFSRTGIPSWIPMAPLVALGIPSPFSGMTRSFVAVAGGHLPRAFAHHPIGPLLFAYCIVAPFVVAAELKWGQRPAFLRPKGARGSLLGLPVLGLLVVWLVRIVGATTT